MVILREVLSQPKNPNSDQTQNTAHSQNYKENCLNALKMTCDSHQNTIGAMISKIIDALILLKTQRQTEARRPGIEKIDKLKEMYTFKMLPASLCCSFAPLFVSSKPAWDLLDA